MKEYNHDGVQDRDKPPSKGREEAEAGTGNSAQWASRVLALPIDLPITLGIRTDDEDILERSTGPWTH